MASVQRSLFRATHAVVRAIPDTIVGGGLRLSEPPSPIDLPRARAQHELYVDALRKAGVSHITQLESDPALPDCCFVEDTAIAIGDTVLMTTPGAPSRQAQVHVMEEHFLAGGAAPGRSRGEQWSMRVINTGEEDPEARVDGGDVLFTGHEVFVGESSRTNAEGVRVLRAAFPHLPIHRIPFRGGSLHLKSLTTVAGERTLLFAEGEEARAVREMILDASSLPPEHYRIVEVPDYAAANCVFVNGTLIHRSEFPESAEVLRRLEGTDGVEQCVGVEASEIEKVDGALTCCSVLFTPLALI